ncbi:DNA polymerase III subunit epsilon [Moraxella bovoculi]|uniref:DNA polymerase III subunit epsilon n=1 Tax=Moraxella bovoculi TaxID=386891 RepID=UPI000624CB0E|nr:DNA polymerase III subunit epsilon [Moraxella bovoculi]AKG16242.2 DNA polymerase III subunit epsilon [Moraxella bovoculi]AKG18754.1 DNA polymerase III subunit epsilon [Moraxella bovoculi]NSM10112.1 DNA polymerase III subunit epsilon [Moraxella bovoculi]
MNNYIIAYTDGACKGNGKQGASAGGFGAHIIHPNGDIHNLWGGEADTTNNRMELLGAITALKHTPTDTPIQIWTDSGYVKDGITQWIHNWKKNGWRKADKKPVLNVELWQDLDALTQGRMIDWQWIKGHAGHEGNEMADQLANQGVIGAGEEYISSDNCDHPTDADTSNQSEPNNTNNPKQAAVMNDHTFKISPDNNQNPDYDGNTQRANGDFWAILPSPNNYGSRARQLIMDTETTGFEDQGGDRIVEVGIVEIVDRKFTGNKLHVYINPEREMDDEVIRVHGISNEFLLDKPKFADVAQQIYDFMIGSEVIAHNAAFDMRFLKMEFDKVGLTDFLDRIQTTDSLAIAKELYPGQKNSLDALVRRLDVGNQDRTFHGALLDSEILAEVYLAMTGGQMAIKMEYGDDHADAKSSATGFQDLSDLAGLICTSAGDMDADSTWRATVLS